MHTKVWNSSESNCRPFSKNNSYSLITLSSDDRNALSYQKITYDENVYS